ncbi:Histidinol-phosphate aminotransferase [Candidatus Sumerlaea chitinivorans]|jgi:histidinol-phosphate aminotransferase|uniref:Histidinol-phosphate aminotransferase n=1 Tax=Sumerlaea chitinivorans TaxID=2250252 RepID=A0A2Z4Y3H4_SUMC1|nr:Histidinol-phosphate aminotransferase [Candidatus Sumerlaea chitinivorans]
MEKLMSLRVNPAVEALAAYVPGEQPRESGFIKLNTNENPYPAAPEVERAIAEALQERSLQKYPDPACSRLRQSLAERLDVSPENILVGNGSDEVLRLVCHAYLDPKANDSIAMLYPTYVLYRTLAAMFNGACEEYQVEGPDYRFPEAAYASEARVFFLANPNPPIGTQYDIEVIARLAEARPERLLVVDEAYVDFAGTTAVPLVKKYPNLAVTRTFSKSYALAGMRVGFIVASSDVISQLEKIKDSYNVNRLSQIAAQAAWEAQHYYEERTNQICATRESLRAALLARGFEVPRSFGNFVFARHSGARELYAELKQRHILVRYFDLPGLQDGIRITIGTPDEIQALLVAIDEILSSRG